MTGLLFKTPGPIIDYIDECEEQVILLDCPRPSWSEYDRGPLGGALPILCSAMREGQKRLLRALIMRPKKSSET